MSKLQKVFWISLLVKLVLAVCVPMTSDETYYWVWSYHPQLSYYDHPALVAVLYWLGQPFEFLAGAVRWPGVLLSQASLWIWIQIFRRDLRFTETQLTQWLWLCVLQPLVGAGSIIVTPDIPLLFFWPLSIWMFLVLKDRPGWMPAFAFGLTLGLGLLSKYMIVLLPLALLVAQLFDFSSFKRLVRYLPIVVLGAVLASLPLWIWNSQNQWVSFGFQLDHGISQKPWKPSWTYEYILVQLLILFPPLIYLFVKNFKRAPAWLLSVTLIPLLFFFFTSFRGYVEANWPIMVYPSFLAVVVLTTQGQRILRFTQAFWASAIVVALILVTTGYSPFSKPIKTREFFEFEALYSVPQRWSPIFADSYQMASRLSFASGRMIYKLNGLNRRDNFDFWPGSVPADHFYLILRADMTFPKSYIEQGYSARVLEKLSDRFDLWEVKRQ